MKILLDMNVPIVFLEHLNNAGFEVVRWSQIGDATDIDADIVRHARNNDFIILTSDLDFGTILAATGDLKPSVILMRLSLKNSKQIADLISAALIKYADRLAKGAVLSIKAKKVRIRDLPL
ncbi:MAG: DUF5615 family PIN-like protein [Defluviitaleaceae bacterium]|nr:DUF5615 family PIN-like protein [Defluviitaleaceae bacterium]